MRETRRGNTRRGLNKAPPYTPDPGGAPALHPSPHGTRRHARSLTLGQRHDAVGLPSGKLLARSPRPLDFDPIVRLALCQADVNPAVVLRDVAASALHFAREPTVRGLDHDARADRISVGLHPHEPHEQPVLMGSCILQEARPAAHATCEISNYR